GAMSVADRTALDSAGNAGQYAGPIPPTITAQPQNRTNIVGSTATFAASASGSTPLSYQWFFGAGAIAGGTDSTLVLTSVTASNAGPYQVIVTNAYGSATSAVASLTVLMATPSVSWANPSAIIYGSALSSSQLN